MTDLSVLSKTMAAAIIETVEYKTYKALLEELKAQPDLYQRVNEIREKNFRIQYQYSEDMLESIDALTNEYDDVINIELVGKFIDAEAALCKLVQSINADIISELEFE